MLKHGLIGISVHASSWYMGISSPDVCTLHLSPLYHLEEVIEEVSRNRY